MATTDLKAVELRLRAILERYQAHLVESTIYSMPVLRRKGAKKHDWFAGVQPVDGAVKFNFLPLHENAICSTASRPTSVGTRPARLCSDSPRSTRT